MRDATLRRILYATSPLLLWAGHFALMYLLAIVHAGSAAMIGLSVLAIGGAGWLLWRAVRNGGDRPLHELAMALNALLAFIAIVWTSVPLLLLR